MDGKSILQKRVASVNGYSAFYKAGLNTVYLLLVIF